MNRRLRTPLLVAAGVLLAIISSALFAGCGSQSRQTAVVRIGYLRNDLHQLAFYVARENGYFDDEGLDVREGGVFSAGPEEMGAFSAGDLDMGYVGTAPALTFAAQDMADVRIVAQVNEIGSAIVVRNSLEADDVAALRGRTIAIPGYSTVQDMLLRLALAQAKVNEKEVNIISLKPLEMISELSSGQVDAFIAWEPYPSQAVEQNVGRVLISSAKIWPRHPCCVLVADSEYIRRNPDTVRKVVAAHERATSYIRNNPEEAADMAHLFTGQDRAVVNRAMKNVEFVAKPQLDGIDRYAIFLSSSGIINDEDPRAFVKSIVDTRFLTR